MNSPVADSVITADDRCAIAQLMAQYCHGIDHREWGLVRSCFKEDAVLLYGQYNGDTDGFIHYAELGLSGMIRCSHQLGQTYLERCGELVRAETYATCFHRYPTDGGKEDLVVGARYVDDLTRGDSGAWRITRRVMVYDWTRIDEVGTELGDPSVIRGSVGSQDPWYGAKEEAPL